MARFEPVYYEGEVDERLPEWQVVEWTMVSPTGAKFGNKVWSTYDLEGGEEEANLVAMTMQTEYNIRMYNELG